MSLAWRVAVAIVLIAIYIALAIGAIVGLAKLGLLLLGWLPDIRGRGMIVIGLLGVASLAAAAVILWSMIPRPDKFTPPGPEITPATQPELFAQLHEIASATGEPMPRHVYVMWDVNAFVAQRGGVLGVGTSRVMGLGLPLLRALTVSELAGVIAHEMGHFCGGDTKLGPWIYKTRRAVLSTIVNLASAKAKGAQISDVVHVLFAIVLAPFSWFGNAFMRVTQAVSRAQELGADRVGARVVGTAAMIAGLKKTHAAGAAFGAFMHEEVMPLVDLGALPPVGEGFAAFLASSEIKRLTSEAVDVAMGDTARDPFDSHPPLPERIAALGKLELVGHTPDARPAIELVRAPAQLERKLFALRVDRPLDAISWADVHTLWERRWKREHEQMRAKLAAFTIGELPTTPRELGKVFGSLDVNVNVDVRGAGTYVLGTAIIGVLLDHGYRADTPVGAPVALCKDSERIEVFRELASLIRGELDRDTWRARWTERGLADEHLG